MATTVVHDGNFSHAFPSQSLKLSTEFSIHIEFPQNLRSELGDSAIWNQLTSKKVWMSRGDGLQISLKVSTDDLGLSIDQRRRFIEALGIELRGAEIWSRLSLQTSLSVGLDRPANSEFPADIFISLNHTGAEGGSQDLKAGKKERSLISSNTRPPSGFLQAALSEIRIVMNFSKSLTQNAPKLEIHSLVNTRIQNLSSPSSTKVDASWDYCKCHRPHSLIGNPGSLSKDLIGTAFESQIVAPRTNEDDEMLDQRTSTLEETPTSSKFIDRGIVARPLFNLISAGKLVDAAVRTLISDTKIRLSKGVKIERKSSSLGLSNIAPALFSPDYLLALSHRNPLYIIIAKSISSVYQHTEAAPLEVCLEHLLHSPMSSTLLSPRPSSLDTRPHKLVLVSELQVRIWTLMQRMLFDHSASRRLPHIDFVGNGAKVYMAGGLEEMLDRDSALLSTHETSQFLKDEIYETLLEDSDSSDGTLLDDWEIRDHEETDEFDMLFEDMNTTSDVNLSSFPPVLPDREDYAMLFDTPGTPDTLIPVHEDLLGSIHDLELLSHIKLEFPV